MSTPTLWVFRRSPFAGKARAAFAEKGVEVHLAEVNPTDRHPRLRELNPANKVPVLELPGGLAIRESSVILEWLEETHPQPRMWPEDPDLRAWGRGASRWIDDHPTAGLFGGMRRFAFGLEPGESEDLVAKLFARVPASWPVVEELLGRVDGPWLCGARFTFADLSGLPLAVRLPEWQPELQPDPEQHPRTAAWLAALRERPSASAIDAAGERVR